jgi:hypothetical protein
MANQDREVYGGTPMRATSLRGGGRDDDLNRGTNAYPPSTSTSAVSASSSSSSAFSSSRATSVRTLHVSALPPCGRPTGLPNPRMQDCCDEHPGGRLSNFCYQNAVYQCLASLPWRPSMLPDSDLALALWRLLRDLRCPDDGSVVGAQAFEFITRHGVSVDDVFGRGKVVNCFGEVHLPQGDAGEFFQRLVARLYREQQEEEQSPFHFTMSVQHFEAGPSTSEMYGRYVKSETETHGLLMVRPVDFDLNKCIRAAYDERNRVRQDQLAPVSPTQHQQQYYQSHHSGHLAAARPVAPREIVKLKQTSIDAPGPHFLVVYFNRIRIVQPEPLLPRRSATSSASRKADYGVMSGASADAPTARDEKDSRVVGIPLRDFRLEGKSTLSYNCVGIVCHLGEQINAGHYVAYVRRNGAQWFLCDDDHVTQMSAKEFEHKEMFEPIPGSHHVPTLAFFERAGPSRPEQPPPAAPLPAASPKRPQPAVPPSSGGGGSNRGQGGGDDAANPAAADDDYDGANAEAWSEVAATAKSSGGKQGNGGGSGGSSGSSGGGGRGGGSNNENTRSGSSGGGVGSSGNSGSSGSGSSKQKDAEMAALAARLRQRDADVATLTQQMWHKDDEQAALSAAFCKLQADLAAVESELQNAKTRAASYQDKVRLASQNGPGVMRGASTSFPLGAPV